MVALSAVVAVLVARPAAAAAPNDPRFASQWGLSDIKAPDVWDRGVGGGIRIAVVSTGIAKHPDLASKIDAGYDAATDPPDPTSDTAGRGTHLAGIAAAATNNGEGIAGVAPGARLLPYKAFASTSSATTEAYVEALVQVQKARPQVVLVDLPDALVSQATVQQSLKNLGDAGISVAVGAGGASLADLPVLTVAATSSDGGQVGAGVGPRGVAAPGGGVVSTTVSGLPVPGIDPYGYGDMSGTSQAAAHVAGALAILRGIGAGPVQAADLLRSTARKSGNGGFGAGMIDVAAAVGAYRAPPGPTTTTTAKPGTPPATTKASPLPGGTIPKPVVVPSGPSGPTPTILGSELPEPGEGDSAVLPPGSEDFLAGEDTGGPGSSTGQDDRPLGLLAVGFGLLFGVGSGLSVTFRRLAAAPL